jgi:hypothetical protein
MYNRSWSDSCRAVIYTLEWIRLAQAKGNSPLIRAHSDGWQYVIMTVSSTRICIIYSAWSYEHFELQHVKRTNTVSFHSGGNWRPLRVCMSAAQVLKRKNVFPSPPTLLLHHIEPEPTDSFDDGYRVYIQIPNRSEFDRFRRLLNRQSAIYNRLAEASGNLHKT